MQRDETSGIEPRALGRRLQEARRARGMTQQDVADTLGLARTTVTALEKGERRARPDEIIRMAGIFGRSVGDLVGDREPIPDFAVQFRTAVSDAGSEQAQEEMSQAVLEFQRLCEDYLYIERLSGTSLQQNYIPQYSIPGASPEIAAEDVASAERNRLGLGDGPILNLREVLEDDVAIRVFSTNLPSRVAGLFAYTAELGGCIAVNALHPQERRRWSMAHEYGHFLTSRFHSEISILGTFRRVPAAERFADAFARCFLMPATGLRRRFNEMSRANDSVMTAADICRISHYYFVSVETMTLRLEELRLLPGGTWDRLRDRGFRVREAQQQLGLAHRPDGDSALPIRYQLLVIRAYGEGNLTEGELSRLLRSDRVSARRTVQRMTQTQHIVEGGELESLTIDLAARLAGQGA
ncbi:MAG: XRE family transcriptional regulator [Dehalococcoidia bacterium]|nr:XRE family transcriptional regulator [Dehalococcoidia bacterium]